MTATFFGTFVKSKKPSLVIASSCPGKFTSTGLDPYFFQLNKDVFSLLLIH